MKIQISVSTKNESILKNLHKELLKSFNFCTIFCLKRYVAYVVNSLNQSSMYSLKKNKQKGVHIQKDPKIEFKRRTKKYN